MRRQWSCGIIAAWIMCAACAGSTPAQSDKSDTYTDAMAREHKGDTPTPTPASETTPAAPVDGRDVVYATVDGAPVTGYLAAPKTGAADAPTLIVIHEWWGLNPQIKSMTRQLAAEGYVALAVDLYQGATPATTHEGAKALMMKAMANPERAHANLRQATAFLQKQSSSDALGVIGWCFGGAWSLQTALKQPDAVDAAVIYYGRLVTDPDALKPINAPILGVFGAEDKGIPVDQVRAFEASLKKLGKPHAIHVYPGADHAFANPSGTRYNAAAAEDAWAKTRAFLSQHLQGGAP